jgi:hypothetical protein
MAQFTIYKSSDTSAPSFYGTTGSVVALLDACLVNGYGTEPGAGWLKPLPNTGSGAFSQSYGCYQQPTGSQMYLFINDNAPNGTALYREAWATGWETLVSLSSSVSDTCGSGSGQFPLPSQLLTTGHTVIRKSSTSDSSSLRQWTVAADSSSFYMFIATGDTANMYYGFGFGDIYSFAGSGNTDAYRCIIMGRNAENTSAAGNEGIDFMSAINTATQGHYMPRTYAGSGTSITVGKHGDSVKGGSGFVGNIPFPNSVDNALYVSPVWVCENATSIVRGQLRGFYQICHPVANFLDGQTFNGALDYNGKSFLVMKTTPNSGIYGIETSNTLLTN